MGEVYKARDTRLDRTVAVKVLPEYVAADPALPQRFVREAKTLAALSHPHICPVFDVGRQDGIDFLVMEHLEGDTLAQRLAKGALPIAQALAIAIEIADAPNGRGGTWNSEGVILFTPSNVSSARDSVITRVPAAGGTPRAASHLADGEGSHRWPQFLPDGRWFMFFSTNGRTETQGVYLGSLNGGEPIRVLATETPGVFVPPDRVLLVRGDALMAARFDAARGTVVGELMSLAQPVGRDAGWRPARSPSRKGRSRIEPREAARGGSSSGWIAPEGW